MLTYRTYKLLQDFVHQGHERQKRILREERSAHNAALRSRAPAGVLEIGCGGGNLATVFDRGEYAGIDPAGQRIDAARRENAGYRFEALGIEDDRFRDLLSGADFIFCHGVMHHLDDRQCHHVLDSIREYAPKPATCVVIEPVLPRAWMNPVGWILAKLDDGDYIRTPSAWRALFGADLARTEWLNFFPRWPGAEEVYVLKFNRRFIRT